MLQIMPEGICLKGIPIPPGYRCLDPICVLPSVGPIAAWKQFMTCMTRLENTCRSSLRNAQLENRKTKATSSRNIKEDAVRGGGAGVVKQVKEWGNWNEE